MKIVKTPQFGVDQLHIEDHIFESNDQQVKFVEKFIEELDAAVQWVGPMPQLLKKMKWVIAHGRSIMTIADCFVTA